MHLLSEPLFVGLSAHLINTLVLPLFSSPPHLHTLLTMSELFVSGAVPRVYLTVSFHPHIHSPRSYCFYSILKKRKQML